MTLAPASTQLARYTPPDANEWESMNRMATAAVNSGFLPRGVKTANQALMLFLAGRECGWSPIMSLQFIDVINQKPRVNSQGMLNLSYERIPGFQYEVTENTKEVAVVRGRRNEKDKWQEIRFDVNDAEAAGLLGNSQSAWPGYQRDMLRHRATSRLLQIVAADALTRAPIEVRSYAEVLDEDEPPTNGEPAGEKLAAALEGAGQVAVVSTGNAKPVVEPELAAAQDKLYREKFLAAVKKLGWPTRKEKIIWLLDQLGVAHGKGSDDMLPGQWQVAYDVLAERYADKLAAQTPPASPTHPATPKQASEATLVADDDAPPADGTTEPPGDDPGLDLHGARDLALERMRRLAKALNNPARPIFRFWPDGSQTIWITDPVVIGEGGLRIEGKNSRKFDDLKLEDLNALNGALDKMVRDAEAGRG